jgi:Ser-tRNA(Ala) deacylase AlaX
MKKILVTAFVILLSLNTITAFATDKKNIQAKVSGMTEEQKDARYVQMKLRVDEIKNMDKSTLSREEKKELRQELKDMNKEAKASGRGGVYLSLSAIIIVVLILILIL